MGAGDPFSSGERYALDEAIRRAEQASRAEFSVFVGRGEGDPRVFASQLHRSMVAPDRSVLIMVDVDAHTVEVVTGAFVRRTLSDREVELCVLEMTSAFALGDLVGGLKRGIAMLAEHARPAATLHAGE